MINTCAIREAAEQKVIGRQGHLARLKAANPGLRVVLTGCSVREPDRAGLRQRRYPAVDLFLRPGRGAGARRPPRPGVRPGAHRAGAARSARPPSHRADRRRARPIACRATRAAAIADGAVARASPRSAPGCRSSTAATRRAPTASSRSAAGRSGAARSTSRRRGARAGRGGLPRGHAARPERQLVRPRPARRAALRARRHRALGRPPPRPRRPARPRRAAPGDRRDPHRRRRAGDPAAALRDLASVGPVGPADRGDGRVPVRVRAPAPAGPVGRRRGAAPDGPPVHDRAVPRALVERLRAAIPGIALTTDVIVGFCGETEAQFEATLDLLRDVRYDQVFAAAFSRPARHARGAARRRRARQREATPAQRAARAPGGDRAVERNQGWVGRTTEVLVERVDAASARTTTTTPTEPRRRATAMRHRPQPRAQARPPRRVGDAGRAAGRRPGRARRPVRAARPVTAA